MTTAQLHDLDHIEQALDTLQSQLTGSFAALDRLAEVQRQFDNLAQTYQRLQHTLASIDRDWADRQLAASAVLDRLAQAEEETRQLGTGLEHMLHEQSQALETQMSTLRSSLDQRATAIVKDIVQAQAAQEQRATDIEQRWQTTFEASLRDNQQQLGNQAQATREKLQALDTAQRSDHAAVQRTLTETEGRWQTTFETSLRDIQHQVSSQVEAAKEKIRALDTAQEHDRDMLRRALEVLYHRFGEQQAQLAQTLRQETDGKIAQSVITTQQALATLANEEQQKRYELEQQTLQQQQAFAQQLAVLEVRVTATDGALQRVRRTILWLIIALAIVGLSVGGVAVWVMLGM